jgi:hypothetical protein
MKPAKIPSLPPPSAILILGLLLLAPLAALAQQPQASPWPAIGSEQRPWAYWWWHGSAVDPTNLTHELERYRDAGLGGVHIIPIYGTQGYESKNISYLSPKWMDMLRHTVSEAHRLGLGVDMTMGSGWCFGGPQVTEAEANATLVSRSFTVDEGDRIPDRFDPRYFQALVAFSPDGYSVDLTQGLQVNGLVNWTASNGVWRVFAISQRPSGQQVKRAGPGGQGHMLNLFYPPAMSHFLAWFDNGFTNYPGPKPRAMYHDSYEYRSDWSPDFFAQFEKRRGYRLQFELPALLDNQRTDRAARVKSDYRETISDIMAEETLQMWNRWSHAHGYITRNEAHGSPGNWLDLYAVADIPETEMFHTDRNRLVSKFASSAAHVTGKNLVSSETGTWLEEHFTETLADMKYLLDDFFLSGINHVFYHGTCYSPDEAGWPGWLFYASYEMNPRNSVWHDARALNDYAARCQAVLQSGKPDNDILIYWPIYDVWHNPAGMVQAFTVHARDWFEQQPIGLMAKQLWDRGFSFDYVSDRQLTNARTANGLVQTSTNASYKVVVIPACDHIPLPTLRKLLDLARDGATVIFEKHLPGDVPGWSNLEKRRESLKDLTALIAIRGEITGRAEGMELGKGHVLIGDVEQALAWAKVARETLFDKPGLMCVRRSFDGGHNYFIANRSETNALDGWVPLATATPSAVIMDPMSARTGAAALRRATNGNQEVYLQLQPGESVIVRCSTENPGSESSRSNWKSSGAPVELTGNWQVKFAQGGPELPAAYATEKLASWTDAPDTNAARFAGSAVYSLTFDAPENCRSHAWLDLGKVAQSARVRLNGNDLGTLITPPYRIAVEALKPAGNQLEVEVTNVSANRIRDLDRRGVKWKIFEDIDIVNIDYRPFNAANWPVRDSGLLGPVTLTPITEIAAR